MRPFVIFTAFSATPLDADSPAAVAIGIAPSGNFSMIAVRSALMAGSPSHLTSTRPRYPKWSTPPTAFSTVSSLEAPFSGTTQVRRARDPRSRITSSVMASSSPSRRTKSNSAFASQ